MGSREEQHQSVIKGIHHSRKKNKSVTKSTKEFSQTLTPDCLYQIMQEIFAMWYALIVLHFNNKCIMYSGPSSSWFILHAQNKSLCSVSAVRWLQRRQAATMTRMPAFNQSSLKYFSRSLVHNNFRYAYISSHDQETPMLTKYKV